MLPPHRFLDLWHAETIRDHLGQVYGKMGERKRAQHIYALTVATIRPDTNEPLRKKGCPLRSPLVAPPLRNGVTASTNSRKCARSI